MTSVGLQTLINEVLASAEYRGYTTNGEDTLLAEFRMDAGPDFGVSVVGEFGGDDKFRYEYCYPYVMASEVSTTQKITVEPRIREEAFAGVCEDARIGVTLIFHLQNLIEYSKRFSSGGNEMAEDTITGCRLAALSDEGTILMPLQKTEPVLSRSNSFTDQRNTLMKKAIDGDDNAMQSIAMEDMDLYASVNKHLETQDILRVRKVQNKVTEETLVQLQVSCNDIPFTVQINEKDLYGEPLPGRRFKGVIWMQGMVDYPDAQV